MSHWVAEKIGDWEVQALSMANPEFNRDVMGEIEGGEIDVYYDTRWETSRLFARWLLDRKEIFTDKRALVLGCGIGLESLSVARYASRVWCNDLSPVACAWTLKQLEVNGLAGHALVGSYLECAVPDVDIVIGSFLVYNEETAASLASFVSSHAWETVFANDGMSYWSDFLGSCAHRNVQEFEGDQFVMCHLS